VASGVSANSGCWWQCSHFSTQKREKSLKSALLEGTDGGDGGWVFDPSVGFADKRLGEVWDLER